MEKDQAKREDKERTELKKINADADKAASEFLKASKEKDSAKKAEKERIEAEA